MLHLHGFQHHQRITLGDFRAFGNMDRDQFAGHRRGDVAGIFPGLGSGSQCRFQNIAMRRTVLKDRHRASVEGGLGMERNPVNPGLQAPVLMQGYANPDLLFLLFEHVGSGLKAIEQ